MYKGEISIYDHHWNLNHPLGVWVMSIDYDVPPKLLREFKYHTRDYAIQSGWRIFDNYWNAYAAWLKENKRC